MKRELFTSNFSIFGVYIGFKIQRIERFYVKNSLALFQLLNRPNKFLLTVFPEVWSRHSWKSWKFLLEWKFHLNLLLGITSFSFCFFERWWPWPVGTILRTWSYIFLWRICWESKLIRLQGRMNFFESQWNETNWCWPSFKKFDVLPIAYEKQQFFAS